MRGHSPLALIVDDEPEYLGWISEYFSSVGLATHHARSLVDALKTVEAKTYQLIVIDMNIPVGGAVEKHTRSSSPVADKFPGIIMAIHSRSKGYRAEQVIAYTVHDDDAADAELAKLGCRYVLKGRPDDLKAAIRQALPRWKK
jgi:CheY-like chemotaxis protein